MNRLHKNLIEFRNNYVYTANNHWGNQNGHFLEIIWRCSRYVIVKARFTRVKKKYFCDFIPTTYYIFKIFHSKNEFWFQQIESNRFGKNYHPGKQKMINSILKFRCTNCRINCGKKEVLEQS